VPLHLYVRGGTQRFPTRALSIKQQVAVGEDVKELTSHPMLDLLLDANPTQTGLEARELTALYEELTGNAYWYCPRNALGVPTAFWPLMSQYVKVVSGDEGPTGYLYGRTPETQQAYSAEDVIHFRYPNPSDQDYGLGPLQAAVRAVDRHSAMAEYMQEFFDNSARIDFALRFPDGTPAAERDRILAQWREKYSGKKKRHLPGVLVGDMGIETFSFSPQDATLIDAMKLSREEIAGIFGIPMSFLEISAARAEAEAHLWQYAQYTLLPRLRRMEQTLNERLVPMFDDSRRLFTRFEDPTPENVEQESAIEDRHLRNYSLSINEARAGRGEPPVAWGDMPLVPATGMPIGTEPPAGTFGPVARDLSYCPICKSHHKGLPPLTDPEARLQALAERWWAGMRRDTLARLDRAETPGASE